MEYFELFDQYKDMFGIEYFKSFVDEYTTMFREMFSVFQYYKENSGEVAPEAAEATQSIGEYLGSAGMTVLTGLVVVIGTLFVLTLIFYLFGFIMKKVNAPKTAKKEQPAVKAPVAAPAATPAPAPVVQGGISGEVVAAIAAAVAMMAPDGKRYAVRRVSRKDNGGRSAWSAAGIADNTRPF